jgi:CelD/BcsL family acetyltransferase involved in cellulose biosynthesis
VTRSSLHITVARPADLAAVAADWRALEARADGSFFQSWTWVGCLVAERFRDPVLLRALSDGELVGLALLNRTGATLRLAESGDAALDAVYVEHNGLLLARGHGGVLTDCVGALLRAPLGGGVWRRRLVMAGTDAAHLAAARAAGAVRSVRDMPAPWLDLTVLDDGPDGFLASLSANARQQLRRSNRRYAAIGPVTVRRAATLAEAQGFLAALAELHQATWTARGRPGAFANAAFRRFHAALLARAVPRGEVDLLRVTAGTAVVGYLYNFRHRGRVLAYQSGFEYRGAPDHAKPGLTCHHAAIELARREGMRAYDFLAGGDRYKTSLANASATLHWLEVAPRWSAPGMAWRLLQPLRGWRE